MRAGVMHAPYSFERPWQAEEKSEYYLANKNERDCLPNMFTRTVLMHAATGFKFCDNHSS